MGLVGELAQGHIHSVPYQETARIRIAGQNITDTIESATVTYNNDGTSEATINTFRNFRNMENADVTIDVGYGNVLENYFTGQLGIVEDNSWGAPNELTCWGPFKLMADQILGEQVSYSGWTLTRALNDLVKRSGYKRGQIEVKQGGGFTLSQENTTFVFETKIAEVANTLCQSANYVFTDLPGGRRMLQPRPRPGSVGAIKARYNESNLQPESFTATPSNRNFYSKVRVFRRNEAGGLTVNVTRPIGIESKYRPPEGRTYVIPDFVGTQQDAEKEATAVARSLSRGIYAVEMANFAANPEVVMYDTIQTKVTELREFGSRVEFWMVTYNWLLDQSITLNIGRTGNTMTATGTGVIEDERWVKTIDRG